METLRNIYYGRTSNPNIKTVMAMAEALDMTINSLLGVENTSNNEERKLINYFRNCGKHGKNVILNIAKYEASLMKETQEGLRILEEDASVARKARKASDRRNQEWVEKQHRQKEQEINEFSSQNADK